MGDELELHFGKITFNREQTKAITEMAKAWKKERDKYWITKLYGSECKTITEFIDKELEDNK